MLITFRGRACVFLDVEASGLGPASYPIEVGWVRDLAAPPGSVLIRPAPGWTAWNSDAERLHGITRESLAREGLDVAEACARVEAACAGCLVFSDAPSFDDWWLTCLYEAASIKRKWHTVEVEALYAGLGACAGLRQRELMAVLNAAERAYPRPHRAGPDALARALTARAIIDPVKRRQLTHEAG